MLNLSAFVSDTTSTVRHLCTDRGDNTAQNSRTATLDYHTMTALDAEGGDEGKALFAQVQFYIVRSDNLLVDHAEAVCLTRCFWVAQSLYSVLNVAGEASRGAWRPRNTTIARRYNTVGRGYAHNHNNNRLPRLRCS